LPPSQGSIAKAGDSSARRPAQRWTSMLRRNAVGGVWWPERVRLGAAGAGGTLLRARRRSAGDRGSAGRFRLIRRSTSSARRPSPETERPAIWIVSTRPYRRSPAIASIGSRKVVIRSPPRFTSWRIWTLRTSTVAAFEIVDRVGHAVARSAGVASNAGPPGKRAILAGDDARQVVANPIEDLDREGASDGR
jgi:hypothetical protein